MQNIFPVTSISFLPLDRTHAQVAVSWGYPSPYDIYSIPECSRASVVENWLKPDYHYYGVFVHGEYVGFRCFGDDAQVPGGDYQLKALDMGGGLNPDYTGRGLGFLVHAEALDFARKKFEPPLFRVTVAEFNHRARRVCEKLGYCLHGTFFSEKLGRNYVIMIRT